MMARPIPRKPCRGFTLLELLVVIAVVVLVYAAAMRNLLPLRGQAEEATFLSTVAALRSSVSMETSRRLVRDGIGEVIEMDGMNPVDLLRVAPRNYVGAIDGEDTDVCAGCWGFDKATGTLLYRVEYRQYFVAPHSLVRFDVHVARAATGAVLGVHLRQLDAADWQAHSPEIDLLFGNAE